MHQPPSILVYGREPNLLRSRCWVLRSAGFQVSSVETLPQAQSSFAETPADVLVICHTLSAGECREALAWARTHPHMKRIVLTAHGLPCSSSVQEGEVLSQLTGPRELIASVHRLLPAGQPV